MSDDDRINPPEGKKPCPFCGSIMLEPEDSGVNGEGAIRCNDCGAHGPVARNPEGVLKSWRKWNKRASNMRDPFADFIRQGAA